MSVVKPKIRAFFHGATNTVTYVVTDPNSRACAVIDPVLDYRANAGHTSTRSVQEIIDYIEERGLELTWILETHAHADHLSAAPYIKDRLGGKIAIGEHIPDVQKAFKDIFNPQDEFDPDGRQFDHLIKDGETLHIGAMTLKAMHTPGHTPACMTYLIEDAAFVGDTLFMPDYGTARCDFPGGDARMLYRSIQKIFALPDETRIFLCHDYLPKGREAYQWETTVGDQKAHNIHVHEGVSEEAFVAMREARDAKLDMPKLILPSVQVNMRAGYLPSPEDNGVSYLKIPLNVVGRPEMSAEVNKIDNHLSVATQLSIADISKLADQGFKTIINNRPDGEVVGQPNSEDLAKEAKRCGVKYISLPVTGESITDAHVDRFDDIVESENGPVLAFCRTGTRCATLWALSEADNAATADILETAKKAGYDLSALRSRVSTRRDRVVNAAT